MDFVSEFFTIRQTDVILCIIYILPFCAIENSRKKCVYSPI